MQSVHVAVAVIRNAEGAVLIQQRAPDTHQGGLWEFPGGKLEDGENLEQALCRELDEELGIQVLSHRPLIQITHDYGDRRVLLDVHLVTDWQGQVQAREQQPLNWSALHELAGFAMPAADKPILTALQLPSSYVITPPVVDSPDKLLERLEQLLEAGERLFLYRIKQLSNSSHVELQTQMQQLCEASGAQLMLHAESQDLFQTGGLHVTEDLLARLHGRPVEASRLLSVSCHSLESLQKAEAIGADFAMLSPVAATKSHPGTAALGWPAFAAAVASCRIPVYALGGMTADMREIAWQNGAQGVAGISSWW